MRSPSWLGSTKTLLAIVCLLLLACGDSPETTGATGNASSGDSSQTTGAGDGGRAGTGGTSSTSGEGSGGRGGAATNTSSASQGGAGGAPDSACETLGERLQDALESGRETEDSPGAVLAVITPDCGKWVGASGESTEQVPIATTDLFRVASVTKTYVAALTLQLVEEGAIDLDGTLATYAIDFPNAAGITIRELLNHTSGVYNYTDDDAFMDALEANPGKAWSPQEIIDVARAQEPYFAPGEGWHYSNTNYFLLGVLLEDVTGSTIGELVRDRLLEPAGLEETFFEGEEDIAGTIAHGYLVNGYDITDALDPSWAWAAGAMDATAGDLADWAVALYGDEGRILEPASLRAMLETVDTNIPGFAYGLGVFVLDPEVALETAWGHPGDTFGYHTQMFYFPERKTTVVAIVNSDVATPNTISINAIELLFSPR